MKEMTTINNTFPNKSTYTCTCMYINIVLLKREILIYHTLVHVHGIHV